MITLETTEEYNENIREICKIHHLNINSNKVIRPGLDGLALNFLTEKLITLLNLYEKTNKFNLNYIKDDYALNLIKENLINKDSTNINEENKLNIVFVTSNKNKIYEMNAFFKYNALGKFLNKFINITYLTDKDEFSCNEDDITFSLIAKQKAVSFISSFKNDERFNKNGSIIFTEDSGIEILCLENCLGTRSKRFAYDNINYIVSKYTEMDYSMEYISELVKDIREMNYNSIFNNRIVIMKIKELLDIEKDINDNLYFTTGSYCSIIDNTNNLIHTLGISQENMHGHLNINDILKNTEAVVECKFGFNNMVDLNLSTNRIQYGKVSVDKAIQFNHRALSFANTLTQVFINIFSNNLQGLKF